MHASLIRRTWSLTKINSNRKSHSFTKYAEIYPLSTLNEYFNIKFLKISVFGKILCH